MNGAARPAATVCLLRDRPSGIEVLMARRSDDSRFMAGVWVFPGGAVDEADAAAHDVLTDTTDDRPWRVAALRELVEELGIWVTADGPLTLRVPGDVHTVAAERGLVLDGRGLGYFANWITPEPLPIRFDTRFYALEADVEPEVDGDELVEAVWITPGAALSRSDEASWPVAFPTAKTLAHLASFPTAAEFMVHIATLDRVQPIQPRLLLEDGGLGVLLPGDPGFEEAAAGEAALADRLGELLEGEGAVPR